MNKVGAGRKGERQTQQQPPNNRDALLVSRGGEGRGKQVRGTEKYTYHDEK